MDERQTPLQRIVWRDDLTENIKTYELLTLTYGITLASFLVTKVIHQLFELEESRFPIGAMIARKDFYMDDLSGANSIDEERTIRDQVAALLLKGGFILRKWASNSEELLRNIPGQIMDSSWSWIKTALLKFWVSSGINPRTHFNIDQDVIFYTLHEEDSAIKHSSNI